ncbi:hypothetical protein [Pectinatus frisingensis]|uniref:hypothetical protein n=1 Tax=Pectinatus frisingensis TaxID=865 RepID=UPI0018C83941|nr:hypothetical protein [Pectinatus frisingensis]
MNEFSFKDGDFSSYNHAGYVNCSLYSNGKVDLILEKNGKISFTEMGMFNLTKAWINSYKNMRPQYKQELIEYLNKK